jgi:hypothetical protein
MKIGEQAFLELYDPEQILHVPSINKKSLCVTVCSGYTARLPVLNRQTNQL